MFPLCYSEHYKGFKKMTTKRSAPTPMPTIRATRSKTNVTVQLDDASTGFSTDSAAPSSQVEEISTNFDNHNLTES
jgi:hypothetical protein